MPAVAKTSPARVDGRRARGERTRLRVLEALLALVEEGQVRPTAQEIAARAGVALRTVYHHFEDVEALRRMALDLQLSRHVEALQPVDPTLPLDERVAIVARQCRKLYEAITPIRRATLFDEHASPEMAKGLRRTRVLRRNHVASAFGPELAARADAGRSLLDALDLATAWQSWHYLRDGLSRSALASERVMVLTLQSLFTGTTRSRRR
ncbi:MAG TPA: TetR/AcrR family transcriptional regulator [Acidimicrobiales bacterium]|jgi:TetR/AcrR family transcriptional regulator of autoinduction and epiphytic fitness|nr:TetR/AcrR family transcriptional regulator [Acidimicrobiales bacterium]